MRVNPKRAHTNTALDLPRGRAREQGVPGKVLLVDDDELELSLMADRLNHAGYEVTMAHNGEEALQVLERNWFPVVLTDWQMPIMDGIELVEKLRARGGDDSYFIMLSVRNSSEDFERGYCAGVDDYLSKTSPDTEIMARIEAGFNTVSLRRSLRQSRAALALTQSMAQSPSQTEQTNADAKAHLATRLQAEIARARRYRRSCSVLVLGVYPPMAAAQADDATPAHTIGDSLRLGLLRALQGVIRIEIDTVALYESSDRHLQYAVVLPETGPAEVATIRSRMRAAMLQCLRDTAPVSDALDISVGAASMDTSANRAELTAAELLAAAENCRRCMASCGARRLAAVQSSVVSQVSIPCRHGYAVADHCLELDHRYADESKATARAALASVSLDSANAAHAASGSAL